MAGQYAETWARYDISSNCERMRSASLTCPAQTSKWPNDARATALLSDPPSFLERPRRFFVSARLLERYAQHMPCRNKLRRQIESPHRLLDRAIVIAPYTGSGDLHTDNQRHRVEFMRPLHLAHGPRRPAHGRQVSTRTLRAPWRCWDRAQARTYSRSDAAQSQS
jgi:hypothetical protein